MAGQEPIERGTGFTVIRTGGEKTAADGSPLSVYTLIKQLFTVAK